MSLSPLRFELLIFDWDGTLMDSVASIVACTERALDDLGLDGVEVGEIRRSIGLGLGDSLARLFPAGLPVEREVLIERYRHHWFATYREQPFLFAGARAVLEALAAEGYAMAVATGKGRPGLDRDLEKTGVGPLFGATRTVSETPSKPHPAMLLELCEELGADPAETLMVGDTTYDLEMARSAGASSVAVLTGSHGREELLDWGPLACLESVAELPAWLGVGGSRGRLSPASG